MNGADVMSAPVAPSTEAARGSASRRVVEFLKRNRQRAIEQWEQAVRAIPAAAMLDREELRDHMPALIDRLLELVETPESSPTAELPARHAIERLQEGFSLEQVAWEYSALRSALLRMNDDDGIALGPAEVVLLNDAIDRAVVRAVSKFHHARVRTLEALDRIAQEGLLAEPQALDALLHRLLGVILTSAEAVDTAVLFLAESGRLVIRAAVGLEQELVGRFSLAVGEGFAGTVAQTRKPRFTASAETDPLVRNPLLQMRGVKALYGVPLIHGDQVIGVAKMGSRRAADFAAEDRLILKSTAERSAAFIAHKRAIEDRELFLHVVGHDLRSPLQSIAVGVQLIERQEPHTQEAARNIGRVLGAAERMDRIIADITDFTQTRISGTLPLHREEVDLGALAEQIVQEARARDGKELRLERVGDAKGAWDRGRLLRVIANLVNNALAYSPAATPVTLRVEGDGACVVLRVHNEGDPIPENLQPLLFEAFKRGGRGEGSGLGLFIVQRIAEAHGGRVDVESAAGRGTTFSVRLPR